MDQRPVDVDRIEHFKDHLKTLWEFKPDEAGDAEHLQIRG
ncbi:hypothetical protein ACP70R_034571 [Stipagrostis hirtigluma subsp. patula]